ncbi:hypothetical protein RISK_002655 [Rhodopirellula islandica]|uniref:Uncharacterized protein n=1 Tax=Rhodopirellula islandica TaxID=595434 RepID=A0A0J1BFE0_RHOIS|nr:hypothetical protein RISK_002655 [Rhodopirellula islandica]
MFHDFAPPGQPDDSPGQRPGLWLKHPRLNQQDCLVLN